ncbi:MAG: hypothetical protein IH987_13495 [Planctomycetes bacterium]|nr:hypothetical protein [Planctomycetota bacterium]
MADIRRRHGLGRAQAAADAVTCATGGWPVFFAIAVLATPCGVAMLARLPVILLGTSFLLLFNLVRIVSLYYVGIFFPSQFEIMHRGVWQPVFIFVPLFLWVMWSRRVERRSTVRSHVDT